MRQAEPDVSKATLDLATSTGLERRAANDEPGIAELVAELGRLRPTLVVRDATGGYQAGIVAALIVAKIPRRRRRQQSAPTVRPSIDATINFLNTVAQLSADSGTSCVAPTRRRWRRPAIDSRARDLV